MIHCVVRLGRDERWMRTQQTEVEKPRRPGRHGHGLDGAVSHERRITVLGAKDRRRVGRAALFRSRIVGDRVVDGPAAPGYFVPLRCEIPQPRHGPARPALATRGQLNEAGHDVAVSLARRIPFR